jgi:hypothetical protein
MEPVTKQSRQPAAEAAPTLDFGLAVPDGFATPEFLDEWFAFCELRVEMATRKSKPIPWTVRAASAILRKLGRYDVEVAVTALQDSIGASWQGVFPERVNANTSPSRNTKQRPSIHPSAFEDDQ